MLVRKQDGFVFIDGDDVRDPVAFWHLASQYIYKLSPPMTCKCVAVMSPIHTVSQARKPLDPNAILAVAWQFLGEPSLMVYL